jgi:uncharacterized protein YegL
MASLPKQLLLIALSFTITTSVFSSVWAQGYQLRPEPAVHHFALVVDRSGSMQGAPLQQAIAGAQLFVEQLRPGDRAAVVAFDDRVSVAARMTDNRLTLHNALGSIVAGGNTALYDAIVKAASTVLAEDGARIIVFLTDGSDTSSLYKLGDIRSLGLSEGIFLFGIGLGGVDTAALAELTAATGGRLLVTPRADQLRELYSRVLSDYYQTHARQMAETGSFAIRSLPSGRQVRFGGRIAGRTPLKLDNVAVGDHAVEVLFDRGSWDCTAPARTGHRTYIDARESDLGFDLWVTSRPHGAVVFLDSSYVGTTSLDLVDTGVPGWGQTVKDAPGQLRIPLVPRGDHLLRLVAMPDIDFGPEQEAEFLFDMGQRERVLQVEIMRHRVLVDDGTVLKQSDGERMQEQMRQLDDELDMGEDPLEDL